MPRPTNRQPTDPDASSMSTAVAASARFMVGLAFGSFIVLALPKSAFGVAWPDAAADFGQGLGALGLVLTIHTAGYMSSSVATGRFVDRFGTGLTLVGASAAAMAGLAGYVASTTWVLFLAAAFVLGLGGGLLDAAVNAHTALRHGARAMNILHASFGVGATFGPVIMTAFLAAGGTWRAAYLALLALQAVLTAALWRVRDRWGETSAPSRAGDRRSLAPAGNRMLWVVLAGFVVYAGLEIAAGQWAFSVLTESRGVGESAAGMAVALYWGSFTVGRFAAGIAGDRIEPARLIRGASMVAVAATAAFWWSPQDWVGLGALALLGVALAGIFPAMMLLTPRRVGHAATNHVVGYQLAAASIGIGLIPGAAGLLVEWRGLETIGAVLFAAAVVLVAVTETARALAAAR